MSRALRIEYPGAWYHVMNRGLCRREVFHTQEYALLFYELLDEIHKRYQIEVHAFCLMGNHYHLCIRTPLPNLGKAMRHLNSMFTRRYNRLIKGDGPLFRGRYKAILVEKEIYFFVLVRYIHLNPVTAEMVQDPGEYRWSSYQYLINKMQKPDWLYLDDVLKFFEISDPIHDRENLVLNELDLELKSFFKNPKKFPILGSTNFIEKIKKTIPYPLPQEIPDSLKVIKHNIVSSVFSIKNIINTVAKYFEIAPESISESKQPNKLAKKVAIFLSVQISEQSQRTIANSFINISHFGVSKIYCRVRLDINKNGKLRQDIDNIKRLLVQGVKSRH